MGYKGTKHRVKRKKSLYMALDWLEANYPEIHVEFMQKKKEFAKKLKHSYNMVFRYINEKQITDRKNSLTRNYTKRLESYNEILKVNPSPCVQSLIIKRRDNVVATYEKKMKEIAEIEATIAKGNVEVKI